MKSEYKRINFDNYISFYCSKSEITRECMYEIKMLENNKIKGILETYISEGEEEWEISYKINHKQNFARFIETKFWNENDIKIFIKNFLSSLKGVEEFMLVVDDILLSMEYIFIDVESLKVYFCYIPNMNKDINIALSKFLFDLVDRIKAVDNKVLGILHSCYKKTKVEGFCIEDIEEELENDNFNKDADEKLSLKNKYEIPLLKNLKEEQSLEKEIAEDECLRELDDLKSEKATKTFSIKALFSKKRKEEKVKDAFDEEDWTDFFESNLIDREEVKSDGTEDIEHTVLLNEKLREINPKLHCISDESLNIELKYFPFVIGRQSRLCDFCLDREGVSRVHFRMEKIDDDYIICDLNSRNGIKVEDRKLENEEYCVVRRGYKIEVADLIYIFE